MAGKHLITYNATFLPGQTLDSNLKLAQPPFDVSSLPKLFSEEKFREINPNSHGDTNSFFQVVLDSHAKVKALDINGSLDLTCGPVSGDANIKFAMNNINSGLSLSVIYRITHKGESQEVDLFDLNELKLSDQVLKQIKEVKEFQFTDFVKAYGKYIIIGFQSGGEILYDSTYSNKDSEDKLSVAGGLSVAYDKVPGFSVTGHADGQYKSSDINKSLNVKTSYVINPSSDSDDVQKLLENLNKLTNIKNAGPNDSSLASLKTDIDDAAQAILNPSKNNGNVDLNWTKAIIYPIGSIPCVSAAFTEKSIKDESISGFLGYMNKLYVDIQSKSQDMKAMTNNWTNPPKLFETYAVKFEEIIQLINTFSDYETLSEFGTAYNQYILNGNNEDDTKEESKEDDNKKQIDILTKEFYKINITTLNLEYNADILTPFNNNQSLSATLHVACDNYIAVKLSQDSGVSYETIIERADGWSQAKSNSIESISSKTVLQFVCTNTGGPAGFIALIELSNGKQYMTPDGHFKCTTTSHTPNSMQPIMYRFDKEDWTNFDKVFPANASMIWPNNDQKGDVTDTQTFEFKFADIIKD